MYIELDGHGPLFDQLARALKRSVLQGVLRPGQRMAATRAFAAELGVSRNTVLGAYEVLRAEGLLEMRHGSGSFVTDVVAVERAAPSAPSPVPPPSRYAARMRSLPRSSPQRHPAAIQVRPAVLRARAQPDAVGALAQRARGGRRAHRDPLHAGTRCPAAAPAISDYLARRRGIVSTTESVVVVTGTQQAISLTARVVLDEGDTVVVEEPGYHHAIEVFRAHGEKTVPVRVDAEGIVVCALDRHKPRLVSSRRRTSSRAAW